MKHIPVTKQELFDHIELMRERIIIHTDLDAEILQSTGEILERLEIDIESEEA